jgi:hypothetical protein
MITAEVAVTKPAAGVITTRPATIPEQKPRTEGLPRSSHSAQAQTKPATAAARVVVVKAFFPECFIVPKIFADDDADVPEFAVSSFNFNYAVRIFVWFEISWVVKNVIFGQKTFINKPDEFAV